jgi:hypothetical protein
VERGPVDFWAFVRLAFRRACERGGRVVCGLSFVVCGEERAGASAVSMKAMDMVPPVSKRFVERTVVVLVGSAHPTCHTGEECIC